MHTYRKMSWQASITSGYLADRSGGAVGTRTFHFMPFYTSWVLNCEHWLPCARPLLPGWWDHRCLGGLGSYGWKVAEPGPQSRGPGEPTWGWAGSPQWTSTVLSPWSRGMFVTSAGLMRISFSFEVILLGKEILGFYIYFYWSPGFFNKLYMFILILVC